VFEATAFFGQTAAYNPEILIFVPLGLFTTGVVGATAFRALRERSVRRADDERSPENPDAVLAAWLAFEVAGYFLISPYPAVRRLIGLGIAATLVGARAAARRIEAPEARAGVRVAVAFGAAVALLFFGADLCDARAREKLAARLVTRLPELTADPSRETRWYNGHWEIQYYLGRAGMQPVVADRSQIRPGDWLILTDGTAAPGLRFPADRFRQVDELVAVSASPWSTNPVYYDGPIPLRRQPETQVTALVFRATRDWISHLRIPR